MTIYYISTGIIPNQTVNTNPCHLVFAVYFSLWIYSLRSYGFTIPPLVSPISLSPGHYEVCSLSVACSHCWDGLAILGLKVTKPGNQGPNPLKL